MGRKRAEKDCKGKKTGIALFLKLQKVKYMKNSNTGIVLVTGGAGFIGSHLIEHLIENGYNITCLVRKEDDKRWIKDKNINLIYGDCTRKESLKNVISNDTDYIFHLAGIMRASDPQEYFKVNFEGTKNLVETCIEKRIKLKRFIYVSSVAASGPSGKNSILKETDKPRPVTDYGRSKAMSENYLREKSKFLPFTILRPTLVYGPRNYRTIFSYFKFVSKGLKPMIGDGRSNVIFVKDLARIMLISAKSQKTVNETYFLGEEKIYSFEEIADIIAQVMGKKPITIRFPIFSMFIIGALLQSYATLTRTQPLFDLRRAHDLKYRYWMCDTSKLVKHLGPLSLCSFREGVRVTVEWYRQEGWIK